MIYITLSFIAGLFSGVIIMALCVIAREEDRW